MSIEKPTDICVCGHSGAAHFKDSPGCMVGTCICKEFTHEDSSDLLQQSALKLDLANMELQTIDMVLARRPALAGLKYRTEKIERLCSVNGELLRALQDLLFVIEVPSHWGNVQKEAFQKATKRAETVVRMAEGK